MVGELCFVIVEDDTLAKFQLFIERPHALGAAVSNGQAKLKMDRSRIGSNPSFALDERARQFTVLGSVKDELHLSVFICDDKWQSVTPRAALRTLTEWYSSGLPEICATALVPGAETLAIAEASGRLRLYSLVTQQMKPATVQLDMATPLSTLAASPDGLCLLLVSGSSLRTIHLADFGTDESMRHFDLPPSVGQAVTSIRSPDRCHVMLLLDPRTVALFGNASLEVASLSIASLELSITSDQRSFDMVPDRKPESAALGGAAAPPLLGAWFDVWTRFPIRAELQQDIVSADGRCAPSIVVPAVSTVQEVWHTLLR
jgi:hypothetical protein